MMTVPAGRKRAEEETGAKRSAGVGWFRSKKFRVEGAPSPLFAVLSPVRREEERGHKEEERLGREREEERLAREGEREESLGREREWKNMGRKVTERTRVENDGVNRMEEMAKRMGKSPSTSVVSCSDPGGKGPER